MFSRLKTPSSGRQLVREIRENGPVRRLQTRMDTVRTRYMSRKMGRALYAESRTVELPGIIYREHDRQTIELWPQPCTIDMTLTGPAGKTTRRQHTPDLFVITSSGFEVEEWREEKRLLHYAIERPHHYHKDKDGLWHYEPAEDHFAKMGIHYRLRSADEHPRILLANLSFLDAYIDNDTLSPSGKDKSKILSILKEKGHVPYLELTENHGFKADHLFQMILDEEVYVDLFVQRLSAVEDLVVYENKVVSDAAFLLNQELPAHPPSSSMRLREGAKFHCDGRMLQVLFVGKTEVICREINEPLGSPIKLPLLYLNELFDKQSIYPDVDERSKVDFSLDEVIVNQKRLEVALDRNAILVSNETSTVSLRTRQRWASRVAGLQHVQDRLTALMPQLSGNRLSRLPAESVKIAEKVVNKHHNTHVSRTVSGTFSLYIKACADANVKPMSQSNFYVWIKQKENIRLRDGRRMDYQLAPIPLTFDCDQPVHGVLPHEVIYIDHTISNIFLRGIHLPDLGKPTLTLAIDGALSMPRAFYLSFQSAGSNAVLMLLRDYARRHGRLPKTIVLDNGKEFHSEALKLFCSQFKINIRWRRRSMPRDSTLVERFLGAIEKEVLSGLDGNTIRLKDPRMVSSSVQPSKFIKWTLPALYGSIDHYLFQIYPMRIHPRFGISPYEKEMSMIRGFGSREHTFIRYDNLFKLLTAPHSGSPTRMMDGIRGLFVDGIYYWNDKFALARAKEQVEVRVEPWCARVIYVNFRDEWIVAQARDGGKLIGRFRHEYEIQKREERKKMRSGAQKDKTSTTNAIARTILWLPENWDERLREQAAEAYYIYEQLGMTEVLPEARNPNPAAMNLGLKMESNLVLIRSIEGEPDPTVQAGFIYGSKDDVLHRRNGPKLTAEDLSSLSDRSDEDRYF